MLPARIAIIYVYIQIKYVSDVMLAKHKHIYAYIYTYKYAYINTFNVACIHVSLTGIYTLIQVCISTMIVPILRQTLAFKNAFSQVFTHSCIRACILVMYDDIHIFKYVFIAITHVVNVTS